MFLEIEQKLADLSSPRSGSEPGSVRSQQEAAELLSSKLMLLKEKLVSFQQTLQDRQEVEKRAEVTETQVRPTANVQWTYIYIYGIYTVLLPYWSPFWPLSSQKSQRPLKSRLKRSSSVQEIFSSPKNKLLRQSSLQQQQVSVASLCCFDIFSLVKWYTHVCFLVYLFVLQELEHELSQQIGLTQAIIDLQGSRPGPCQESLELRSTRCVCYYHIFMTYEGLKYKIPHNKLKQDQH